MRKLAVVLALSAASAGCFDDPNNPKTWIKKLDDIREQKEAVRQLIKLKDPAAVGPLIKLYERTRDTEQLKAIAQFKDPSSVPTLIDSLDYSEDDFDRASVAATALGEIGDKSAVEPLIKAASKPLPVKTRANVVKLEAMKALAKMKDPRAVDLLIKIVGTPAEEQDFFLNKSAALALGQFADPRSVPVLIRGLFMSGAGATAGANIFQECRLALVAIGEPAGDKLVETLKRKNPEVEEDAKKRDFFPGIVEQKVSILLQDLHSAKTLPGMLEVLKTEDLGLKAGLGKGVSGHQSLILAVGEVGGPEAVKALLGILNDPKAPKKLRGASAEALNLAGDLSALPSLKKLADVKFIDPKTKTIDPEMGAVVAAAATAYSRLADEANATTTWQKMPPDLEETDAHRVFQAADVRLAVAKECKQDAACYAKVLAVKDNDIFKGETTWIRAEKAAFTLARLGKPGVDELLKQVGHPDPTARLTIVAGLGRRADAGCAACLEALDKQIDKDAGKGAQLKSLADEMKIARAKIRNNKAP